MSKKIALSYVFLLLGTAFMALAASQYNQMQITSAQSEISKPLLDAQITASEEQARSMGQAEADISASSAQARQIVNDSISKIANAFMQTIYVDFVLGLVLLAAGVLLFGRER
ncbi:MAG: hypothetical protein V1708_03260 [Candidatus Micrarchaeota archaeon]